MKKLFCLLLLCPLFFSLAYSQNKQDYIWLFGQNKEFSGTDTAYRFDFNIKPFEIIKARNNYGFDSQNASISDAEGNLLFYSTGCAILNKDAEVMPNGDSLNYDYWYDKYWIECEKLGYPGVEDILILKDPGYQDGYYILHKKNVYYQGTKDSIRLLYSYVDMNLDGGKGDVVYKNRILWNRDNVMKSYLTGIEHNNNKDWWVIQPLVEDSAYLTFLIDEYGIHQKANQNSGHIFTKFRSSASGTARFSPDGSKYALFNYYDHLNIYDFDRETGFLSNHHKVIIYDSINFQDNRFSSVEWSSNGRFLYTASRDELYQIDTQEDDLQDGIRLIDTYNGTLDPFPTPFFLMALAPDCRIYMAPTNGSYSYHVIHQPNELGRACDFEQNGIKLPYASSVASMPNFPRFRVDEEEKCDSTIVSVFGETVWFRRSLKVYPNPSSRYFYIELPEVGKGQLVVSNIHAQIMLTEKVDFNDLRKGIDLSALPSGIFNIEFYPDEAKDRVFYGAQVVKD